MTRLWGSEKRRLWLAIVGAATLTIGASYVMVQQSTRLAANDEPLNVAQMTQKQLNSGATPVSVVPSLKTDLRTDSSVFVTVTDASPHTLASSATLDDQIPLPPSGVFSFTKAHGSDHFTWEPASGVRIATEVLTYKGGYVITGKSLTQAENRINTYGILALVAWLAVMAWVSLLLLMPLRRSKS